MTSNQPWWLTMPVAEVAATILPLFSYSAWEWEGKAMSYIVNWCSTGTYSRPFFVLNSCSPFEDPDFGAVAEAMQVLERAGLLLRTSGEQPQVGLTRLGRHAIQTHTVRPHLGLSDTPPTA